MNLRGRDLPPFEMRADAEAHVELRALRREMLNRLHVEVIVVIVRDQHGIDAGEIRELDRRRMHALRSDRQGRDDVGQHGIGHDPHAVDLHQYAGVTEPDRAQARRGRRAQRCRRQRNHRNFELRLADLTLAIQAQRFPERTPRALRRRVLESTIDPLGRLLHAGESFPIEATAEGGELQDAVARDDEDGDDRGQDLCDLLQAVGCATHTARLAPGAYCASTSAIHLKLVENPTSNALSER